MKYLWKSLHRTKYIVLIKAPCYLDLILSLKVIKKIACNVKITEKHCTQKLLLQAIKFSTLTKNS